MRLFFAIILCTAIVLWIIYAVHVSREENDLYKEDNPE